MMQEVPQLSLSDQPVQVVFQVSAVINGVAQFLVVFTMQVLVTFYRVPYHFIWPLKEWFVLDFL